jgi:hypothetical protein
MELAINTDYPDVAAPAPRLSMAQYIEAAITMCLPRRIGAPGLLSVSTMERNLTSERCVRES